ncbi:alpha-(1,3)-fucosyltransferase C-like [Haliotis rufescens]|uniref:alpha-(1,3)-fucosyltransferase C-like n=1 Tax=Haliotis rufescens TaxID=6454 RepID=UPI00201F9A0D|nr:alpha-(1,3)-fucosyltransferase C-like [Haliotis rufescens]
MINRYPTQKASEQNVPDRSTFQTMASQQTLKYCLALLIATVLCGTVMLNYNESSFKLTGVWAVFQRDNVSHNEGGNTNNNVTVSTIGYKMTFNSSNRTYPYFYKPISFHSSEKYRQKTSYSVNFNHGYHPVTGTKPKLILFYNPPGWFKVFQKFCPQGLQKCPQKHCECSFHPNQMDKADVVIIDAVDLQYRTPPAKPTNQVWILFGLECPNYYPSQLYQSEQWRHVFNWTMTYRLDSDVILPYNILLDQQQSTPRGNFTEIAQNKTKSVLWFVSNCNTPSKRQQYVKELGKHITVDMYGRCGPLKCSGQNCDVLYNKYRFYLSFENSFCIDYVTEKLYKTYSHNIVPVVRGGADYDAMIPKGTFINAAHFSSPKELAKYLIYLEKNVTAYARILENKSRYRNDNGETYESAFCDICVKLHNLNSYHQQYNDSGKWLKQDTCHLPTDV